ncbi:MAG: nucleotidyl transferase AbiEii/AbiGii toxin family protein [Pseudonocardia sp.]|nr:nucleotidyl transferase AbiEii/AbiGii toxin family protein [Pseudonocardia sp.]
MPAPTHPTGYATPAALWRAVCDRSKLEAKAAGIPNKLARQFVYSRFLARVFASERERWMVKGGIAILARVRSARHSQDIDFYLADGTLDTAVAELQAAAARDLGDHLTFNLSGEPTRQVERPGQPGSDLVTVRVDCYAGAKRIENFKVDVVINSVITQPADVVVPPVAITMPGIEPPICRVYPVVDHIADKLCATLELHKGVPSSRVRDLADLVVFARTHIVDAAALREAIHAEQIHRDLAPIDQWSCPDTWAGGYPALARDIPDCREHATFPAAVALMEQFFNPLLSGELDDAHQWNPERGEWIPSR